MSGIEIAAAVGCILSIVGAVVYGFVAPYDQAKSRPQFYRVLAVVVFFGAFGYVASMAAGCGPDDDDGPRIVDQPIIFTTIPPATPNLIHQTHTP